MDNEIEASTENEAEASTEADTENLVLKNNSATQEIATQVLTEKCSPPKIKKCKIDVKPDPRLDKAFSILEGCATRDACEVYGEHIAMKLRTYTKQTQAFVQHSFNDILFKADMGHYENVSPTRSNIRTYSNLQSPYTSTISSPYPSPHAGVTNIDTCSGSSTPINQPAYSPICSPQAVQSSYIDDSSSQLADISYRPSTSVVKNTENGLIFPSASNYIQNFNPESNY